MLKETLDVLEIEPDEWYVDANLGGGGHTLEILERGGSVLAIDRDPAAVLGFAQMVGDKFSGRLIVKNGNNSAIDRWVREAGIEPRGILFDLGWSTLQGEDAARGISFMGEGPLDMRLDPGTEESAQDLLDSLPEDELAELFSEGDEPLARPIARALVTSRKEGRLPRTTGELAAFVSGVYYRKGFRRSRRHPATRAFMALRIRVNREYENLYLALQGSRDVLQSRRGRLVVLSFHSGEDRIVKRTFREWVNEGLAAFLFRKSVQASEAECRENPRARSARMRGISFVGQF
jgi:16S rRNA (cytosine1402-N4)-methyltransferase